MADLIMEGTDSHQSHGLRPKDDKDDEPGCAVCKTDDLQIRQLFKLDCEHFYCYSCLPIWLELACTSESHWPARCCGKEINFNAINYRLDPDLRRKVERRAYEFSVKDKVYCSNEECVTFLGPADISAPYTTISCPSECGTDTCMRCKKIAHDGICTKEPVPPELAALAKEMNWKSCPCCQHMIEITYGCNKMECYCSTLFCYLCQKLWRSCSCKRWVDKQLYFHATRTYLRGGRTESLQKIIARLQGAADCDHRDLRRVRRPGKCDLCGDNLDEYLYRGCNCGLEVCLWCTTGRLWLHNNAEAPKKLVETVDMNERRRGLRRYFNRFTKTLHKHKPKKTEDIEDTRLRHKRIEADKKRDLLDIQQQQLMEQWGFLSMEELVATAEQEDNSNWNGKNDSDAWGTVLKPEEKGETAEQDNRAVWADPTQGWQSIGSSEW